MHSVPGPADRHTHSWRDQPGAFTPEELCPWAPAPPPGHVDVASTLTVLVSDLCAAFHQGRRGSTEHRDQWREDIVTGLTDAGIPTTMPADEAREVLRGTFAGQLVEGVTP